MKKFLLLSLVLLTSLVLSACGKDKYDGLDTDVEGEISVMLWSGDNQYIEDIGHKDLSPEDLTSQNSATIYAVAKAFNEIYPNVKINVFAKSEGPDDDNGSWYQHRSNFKDTYGHWPDVYASTDLIGDMGRGLAADLSVFEDDPMYKSFNESVMGMMNYNGVQAGLPQYLLPWGVYVNKGLAESKNIDVPGPDWTIDEYTRLVKSGNNTDFWGAMDANMSFINTGTKTVNYSLFNYDGEGDHVNLNSDQVRAMLDQYYEDWAENAVWPQYDGGHFTDEFMDTEFGWWGFNAFIKNKVLTLDGDPWMMGDAAHPNPDHWGAVQSDDWDIYPRPSTPYQPNTLGVVLDPIAVHNYCIEDEDPTCNDEELAKLKVAYTFSAFWIGDSRAWQARADQQFMDQGTLKSAMNDSFPLVTGKEFDKQMDIWYMPEIHHRYKDADKMPGFQEVLRIWKAGQFWDVSDKAYPFWHTDAGGNRVANMDEWINSNVIDNVGVSRVDPGFVDAVKAKLPTWNTSANERFAKSEQELQETLIKYYGFTTADFE